MTMRTALCRGAALGALLACVVAPAVANAATKHHHPKTRVVADPGVRSDVEQLKAEVESLEAWKQQQEANAQQTQAQVQQLQGQLAQANDRAARAEQAVAAQIQTIPGAVATAVASHAPKSDKIYYKGITLTLGGFAAAEGVYRSKNNVADIGSNYSKIPYDNSVLAHTDELRGTARQSRLSFLAQGNIDPDTVAPFYGEFDFLADAQTGNSNESNSYSPRIRNVYGALDWNDSGWHLLAGQNWSLATMNAKGISAAQRDHPAHHRGAVRPGLRLGAPAAAPPGQGLRRQAVLGRRLAGKPADHLRRRSHRRPASRTAASPSTTPPPASRCSTTSTTSRSTTCPT